MLVEYFPLCISDERKHGPVERYLRALVVSSSEIDLYEYFLVFPVSFSLPPLKFHVTLPVSRILLRVKASRRAAPNKECLLF